MKGTPPYSIRMLNGVTYCKISIPLQPTLSCQHRVLQCSCSANTVFRGSRFHWSFSVLCFYMHICTGGQKKWLFTAITGVALNLSSASAFDLAYCMLQSHHPCHPEAFPLLQLLSINQKPTTSSGHPRDVVAMTYCTNVFQGQAWTARLLSARKEGRVQVRCPSQNS